MTRLTPEVAFPEAEGWPSTYFVNPYPLAEEHYLVAWSSSPLPPGTEPEVPSYRQVRYRRAGPIGWLAFDFYNGAMSTGHCRRLLAALRHAARGSLPAAILQKHASTQIATN